MKFSRPFLIAAAAAVWVGPSLAADYEKEIRPVLQKFCADCHNSDKKKGDLDLTNPLAKPDFAADHDVWEKMAELMANREMPPEKKPQPSEDERHLVTHWIEQQMQSLAASEAPNPGRVTLRRLNKEEYRRTVYDLIAVDYNPEDFPADEVGYGFNNIGDVLSLSPMLMEKYLTAAEEIARKAISADPPRVPRQRIRGEKFESTNDAIRPLGSRALGLYREGEATTQADFMRAGEYVIRVRAHADLAGPESPKLAIKVGGKEVGRFGVDTEKPKVYELRIKAEAGRQDVSVAYLNNYNDNSNPDPKMRGDRNLFVESVEIEGPLDGKPEPEVRTVDSWRWRLPENTAFDESRAMVFSSNGEADAEWDFPVKDEYLIRVRAHGNRGGSELPKVRIALGGRERAVFDVAAKEGRAEIYQVRVSVDAGKQKISVAFTNDFFDPAKNQDRNLIVGAVEVVGPINAAQGSLPRSHRELITRMPQAGQEQEVAREILTKFARRAYRRNVSDEEIAKLVGFVDLAMKNGGNFLEGIQVAVQAALVSPHFLFRWEMDSAAVKPGEVRHLGDFEVASRLSYFLWSSMPDRELFELAERGELLNGDNLEKQIARMLKDWRSRSLVENFGGQWLQLHNVYEVDPDPGKYPQFSHELREDMRRETFAFIEAIIKDDRSVLDFVDARFTFLNERLARHYGIDGVKGNDFRRVDLPADSPRGGVLTMGSVLLATSMPTRTSPVIRGKWILEQILGTPPPPPPPNVPPLEAKTIDANLPLRKRLEIHRESADCAGCHAKIDPLGFALENFDAIGAFRTMDGPNPVDTAGKLPNGTEINGAADLKKVIKGDKFVQSLAEKMMIYALGRGLERYDKKALQGVFDASKAGEYRFSKVVGAIVRSEPFLKRKTEKRELAVN
jgi:hypothetical protein